MVLRALCIAIIYFSTATLHHPWLVIEWVSEIQDLKRKKEPGLVQRASLPES